MELIQLEIFCRVFKERGFSRAAEALGLAQPTISIRIKELEESLGTPLFNRLGREIEPTAAGRFLYQQALPLLEQQRNLSERMAAFLDRIEGSLVVGTSSALGEHLLPGVLMAFQAAHPQVRVKLRFANDSAKTLDSLRDGDIEFAVIGSDLCGDDVVAQPFGRDELVLVAPVNAAWKQRTSVSMAELAALPLIALHSGSATRTTLEQALARSKASVANLNIVAEFGRTGAILQAVKQGHGVAFVSRHAIGAELEAGTLKVIQVPQLGGVARDFSIAHARRRELSPTARAFLAHLLTSPASPALPPRKVKPGRR